MVFVSKLTGKFSIELPSISVTIAPYSFAIKIPAEKSKILEGVGTINTLRAPAER